MTQLYSKQSSSASHIDLFNQSHKGNVTFRSESWYNSSPPLPFNQLIINGNNRHHQLQNKLSGTMLNEQKSLIIVSLNFPFNISFPVKKKKKKLKLQFNLLRVLLTDNQRFCRFISNYVSLTCCTMHILDNEKRCSIAII